MIEIRTPNENFTGVRAGVKFVKGVGYCEALQAPVMAQMGYRVLGDQKDEKTPQETNVLPSRASQGKTVAKRTRKPKGATA